MPDCLFSRAEFVGCGGVFALSGSLRGVKDEGRMPLRLDLGSAKI